MTPPTLDSPKEDLVINADETLTITCRGQRTLSWVWPETTLVGEELTDRQCPGEPGRPYCKTLVLSGAKGNDTGYYRCYYRDVKAVIDGTTAVAVYVFVRGERSSSCGRSASCFAMEKILLYLEGDQQ
uniref:Immunoglobulin domain-containing protein n=1 Tax=Hucho hucho TaxID=62062 RepID=A0A4W5KL22_9TELE